MILALFIVAAVLAVITLIQSRGANLLGWGLLAVAVGLVLTQGTLLR